MDSPGTMGMLLALALAVVKLLEKGAEWAITRFKARKKDGEDEHTNGHTNGHSAKLDAETAQALKEIHDIVQLRDGDGVPLVYWPRSQIETQKEIAKSLTELNRSNDKIVDRLETISDNTRKK